MDIRREKEADTSAGGGPQDFGKSHIGTRSVREIECC